MEEKSPNVDQMATAESLLMTTGLVAISLGLVVAAPNIITILLAVFVIGARQISLLNMQSDRLLENEKYNDLLGQWICTYPLFANAEDRSLIYEEPKFEELANRKQKIERLLLAFVGITGTKRLVKATAMNLGLAYADENDEIQFVSPKTVSPKLILSNLKDNLLRIIATQLILAAVLTIATGMLGAYLIWLAAYVVGLTFIREVRAQRALQNDMEPMADIDEEVIEEESAEPDYPVVPPPAPVVNLTPPPPPAGP